LIKQATAVRCLDLSCRRKKLAVVDETSNLLVYDLDSQALMYQEPNANSVAWNTEMEDMLAYSGSNMLCIKTGSFPPHMQKLQGFVVGFKGSKIFCLHYISMQTIDVPQSASLYRYIEKKDFETAYKVACLGVTEADWRLLALDALQSLRFDIARKAFIRIRDMRYIDLLNRITQQYGNRSSLTHEEEQLVTAQVLAFQGKYSEAAQYFGRAKQYHMAVEMYTDLRKFDEAKHWAQQGDKAGAKLPAGEGGGGGGGTKGEDSIAQGLILKQAASSEEDGDLRAAGEMYLTAGQHRKAVEIFVKIGALDSLIEVVRQLSSAETQLLNMAVKAFRQHQHYAFAKEAIIKVGDVGMLISLHMESHRWDEAFQLCQQHPEYAAQIYLPWAEWLAFNDRFDDALDAYKKAKRPDLSLQMVEKLTHNAVVEKRYKDAATYFWRLASEMITSLNVEGLSPDEAARKQSQAVDNFWELRRRADVYYAYSYIHAYIQEPFTTLLPENVFNCALYLWNILASSAFSNQTMSSMLFQNSPDQQREEQRKRQAVASANSPSGVGPSGNARGHLLREVPLGISRVYILYALAKQAQSLGAYKLARMAYDKLQVLRVPPTWQHQIDLSCLAIRSKAYSDQDELLPVCNWCMTTNPLLRSNLDSCVNCGHPFIRTFLGFDILPLVEFQPEANIPMDESLKLIASEPNSRRQPSDGWRESTRGGAEVMSLDQGPMPDEAGADLFVQKMLDAASYFVPGEPYQPVRIDRETMAELRPEEVYLVDMRKFSPLLPIRFFRSMIPEVAIAVCGTCGHFFHQETWELEFLQNKCCPYCGCKEIDPAMSVAEAGSAGAVGPGGGSLQPPTSLTSL